MSSQFIYHATRPIWFANGLNQISFRHYTKPADDPPRDHASLNAAILQNPGSKIFAAFFFSDEPTATKTAFLGSGEAPHVVLRANISDPSLANLLCAPDDRYVVTGAHMRYGHDNVAPLEVDRGYSVHPSWGIPFDRLEIKESQNSVWEKLPDYIARLTMRNSVDEHSSKFQRQSEAAHDPEQVASPAVINRRLWVFGVIAVISVVLANVIPSA
jgi:hypothetical protein